MGSVQLPSVHAQSAAVAVIGVGDRPYGLAYDSAKGEVFVANWGGTISVINDSTNTVTATISLGNFTEASYGLCNLAYDPEQGEIFVTNYDGNVTAISDSSNSIVATIPVGYHAFGIAYDSEKGELFVTHSDNVSIISDSTGTVVATVQGYAIQGATGGYLIAYDSGRGVFYTQQPWGNPYYVISGTTNSVSAEIGNRSWGYLGVYDPGRGEIFVDTNGGHSVSAISDSTNQVVATVNIGNAAGEMAYDPSNGEVFVLNFNGTHPFVSVISDSTNSVLGTLGPLRGFGPNGIAYDSARNEVFVANEGNDTVSVLSAAAISPSTGLSALEFPSSELGPLALGTIGLVLIFLRLDAWIHHSKAL